MSYYSIMATAKTPELDTQDEIHDLDGDRASPDPRVGTGTVIDDHDMQRMGKAQELKVCQISQLPAI